MVLVVCSLINDWSRLINLIKGGKTLFEKLQLRIFSLKNKKCLKDMILYLTLPTKINDPVIPTEYHVGKFRTKIISKQTTADFLCQPGNYDALIGSSCCYSAVFST